MTRTLKARPFEDGRWSTLHGAMQVFMDGGLPVRLRYLAIWRGPITPERVDRELSLFFGARFRVGPPTLNGDYLEAPLEMR